MAIKMNKNLSRLSLINKTTDIIASNNTLLLS